MDLDESNQAYLADLYLWLCVILRLLGLGGGMRTISAILVCYNTSMVSVRLYLATKKKTCLFAYFLPINFL